MREKTQVSVEVVDGLWLVHIPRGLLVLTRAQMVEALKRGKVYRRRERFKNRVNAD